MGLLLGVARGSSEPPRLMVFRHDPPGAPAGPILGLVGKGITFDTGGISIKPADGMERMKDDMAGGAAVACAMRAISLLHAPIRAVGSSATENMPGGRAIKPGDILKSAAEDRQVTTPMPKGVSFLATGPGNSNLGDASCRRGHADRRGCRGARKHERIVRHAARMGRQIARRQSRGQGSGRCRFSRLQEQPKARLRLHQHGRTSRGLDHRSALQGFAGGVGHRHRCMAWAEEAKPLPKGPSGVAVRHWRNCLHQQRTKFPNLARVVSLETRHLGSWLFRASRPRSS